MLESKLAYALAKPRSSTSWRPLLFRLDHSGDRAALEDLLASGAVVEAHDTLLDQLRELASTRAPAERLRGPALDARAHELLAGEAPAEHGTWVFFPWSGQLVHVLPEAAYRELRTSRNRYKITPDEQRLLAGKRLGIIGLSVGQASAVTLALEAVGGHFRLADFDTLALSNMNRLRAPVHALGVNKCVLAARQMFEIDPYLDIELFPEGLSEEAVDAFLAGADGGSPLDLLIEECDDLFLKVFARERAKALRIAVMMETNDRGMLDVERFDLEPDRPIFYGLFGDVSAGAIKGLATKDKVPYVLRLFALSSIGARSVASLLEIDQTTSSWPQLASGTMLGGALATDAARRILLGSFRGSGRFFVDLEAIVCDGRDTAIEPPAPLDPRLDPRRSALAALAPVLDRTPVGEEITAGDLRRLVAHAAMAPSGGNMQAWRFVARGAELRCFADPARTGSLLDFDATATMLSIGAAVENLDLAARAMGLRADVQPFADPADPAQVCRVRLSIADPRPAVPPLAAEIARRATNRRLGPRVPLSSPAREALEEAARSAEGRLSILTDPGKMAEVGAILGAADRLRFLSKRMHAELMSELRFTPEEVERTRDGIDLCTLEPSRADYAAFLLTSSWDRVAFLSALGGGGAFEEGAKKSVAAASAIGLLTFPGTGAGSFFQGGRALQRVWLTASALRLALQPMSAMIYLLARLERGQGEGLEEAERRALADLRDRHRALFPLPAGDAEVLLFRVAHADAPSARALRRPVEEILSFELAG
jgi:hypothetical protein